MAAEFSYFVQCLYGTDMVPWKINQANAYFMKFQNDLNSYAICLSILNDMQATEAGKGLALQTMKKLMERYWDQYTAKDQMEMRNQFVQYVMNRKDQTAFLYRMTCDAYAALIAKAVLRYPDWDAVLLSICNLDANNIHMVLDVLARIPTQVAMDVRCEGIEHRVLKFKYSNFGLLPLLKSVLQQCDANGQVKALECLHAYIDNSLNEVCDGFILDMQALGSDMIESIVQYVTSEVVQLSQVAADIMVDLLSVEDDNSMHVVLQIVNRMLMCKNQVHTLKQAYCDRLRQNEQLRTCSPNDVDVNHQGLKFHALYNIYRIAIQIAQIHAQMIWGHLHQPYRSALGQPSTHDFFHFLVDCSSMPNLFYCELGLDFWFFITDFIHDPAYQESGKQGSTSFAHIVQNMLPGVLDILTLQSKLPSIYFSSNFQDQNEIVEFNSTRRAISETIHSICCKWTCPRTNSYHGVQHILYQFLNAQDIVAQEATIFALQPASEAIELTLDEDVNQESIINFNEWIQMLTKLETLVSQPCLAVTAVRLLQHVSKWAVFHEEVLYITGKCLVLLASVCPPRVVVYSLLLDMCCLSSKTRVTGEKLGSYLVQYYRTSILKSSSSVMCNGYVAASIVSLLSSSDAVNVNLLLEILNPTFQVMSCPSKSNLPSIEPLIEHLRVITLVTKGIQSPSLAESFYHEQRRIELQSVCEQLEYSIMARQELSEFLVTTLQKLPLERSSSYYNMTFQMLTGWFNKYGDSEELMILEKFSRIISNSTVNLQMLHSSLETITSTYGQLIQLNFQRCITEQMDTMRAVFTDESKNEYLLFTSEQYFRLLRCAYSNCSSVFIQPMLQTGKSVLFYTLDIAAMLLYGAPQDPNTVSAVLDYVLTIVSCQGDVHIDIVSRGITSISSILLRCIFQFLSQCIVNSRECKQAVRLLFTLLHSTETPLPIRDHMHRFALPSLFQDANFLNAFRCGQRQKQQLYTATLHTTRKRQFSTFLTKMANFMSGNITFDEIQVPT